MCVKYGEDRSMKNDKIKAKTQKKQNVVGRPRIKLDIEILKNLASIGCPTYEIASVLGVSARTLERNYAEIIDTHREVGKSVSYTHLTLPTKA